MSAGPLTARATLRTGLVPVRWKASTITAVGVKDRLRYSVAASEAG
jgi:hypothetical protein